MKKFTEHVSIRDYGKQGLALFDMTTPTNPGNVSCWSTALNYEDRPKDFRPEISAPMSFDEVPMSYYQKGMIVRPGTQPWEDFKVDEFIANYKRWAEGGCLLAVPAGTEVELEIVVVQKDQERFRRQRWAR